VLAIDMLLSARQAAGPVSARGRRAVAPAAIPAPAIAGRGALAMFGAFGAVALAYVAFNYACGGQPLPATFSAAASRRGPGSPRDRRQAECFGSGAWWLLVLFALVPLGRELASLARGRGGALRLEAGWAVALPLGYLALLPYSHRFTRYLVPALVPLAVLAVAGVRDAGAWPRLARGMRTVAAGALLLVVGALHLALLIGSEGFYRYACRYTAERNEAAAAGSPSHRPAVIGTHTWVRSPTTAAPHRDAAGLVSREATPWIGKPSYTDSLTALFDRSGVTHLAVFEEWLPVEGVPPLVVFNTEPEVMRIYPWLRGRTRLLPAAGIKR
jgi:hypothetical protein